MFQNFLQTPSVKPYKVTTMVIQWEYTILFIRILCEFYKPVYESYFYLFEGFAVVLIAKSI